MKTLRTFFMFMILLSMIPARAQQVPIGEWRDHLPWGQTVSIASTGDDVYCATHYGIIAFDKEDKSMSRLTKINGLSDIGISAIRYSGELQTLVVAYTNTNIDLIKDGTVINIPDIKRKQILGNKTINAIYLKGDHAYLACGFGIVVVDIVREEISDTYYIGPNGNQINVLGLTSNSDHFFAATEGGIYKAGVDDPNLANYAVWSKVQEMDPDGRYDLITEFHDRIIVNKDHPNNNGADTLYVYDGGTWSMFEMEEYNRIYNIRTCCDRLLVSMAYSVWVYDTQMDFQFKVWTYSVGSPRPADAIIEPNNDVWVADRGMGLVKTWSQGYNSMQIMPAGPGTTSIYDLSIEGGNLWMVPGGIKGTWANTWQSAVVYSFIDESWSVFSKGNVSALDTVRDMVVVAVNPYDPSSVFAGSWWRGIYEFRNNEYKGLYSKDNSSLEANVIEGGPVVKVGGLAFDSHGNLWAGNSGADKILSRKTPAGEWKAYNLGSIASGKDVGKVIVDDYDQKWILARHYQNNENYLYVFNEQNEPANRVKGLRSGEGNGNIPGSNVYSIASDLDGEVWIGTDEGVAVFFSPERILTSTDYDAQRILVDFDGYVQYLLESEVVTAITVDGANQKWIGTDRAGVFLLSEDGTEQIHHFTEDNSPLFADQITDIGINGETGEVFIGTAKGLISFKGTVTGPTDPGGEVYAYPNPVPPGYTGTIGIRGFWEKDEPVQEAVSEVRITDVSGTLIYTSKVKGGQAVWNGTDLEGRRARSGVYLVFISREDGSEAMVTKILFMN